MDSKTLWRSIALSNTNTLRINNISNEKISLDFVRNLCILYLNETNKDTNKFSEFNTAADFYSKLIPKLVVNGVVDDYQKQSYKIIITALNDITNTSNQTYKLTDSNSMISQIKVALDKYNTDKLTYDKLKTASETFKAAYNTAATGSTNNTTAITNAATSADNAANEYKAYPTVADAYSKAATAIRLVISTASDVTTAVANSDAGATNSSLTSVEKADLVDKANKSKEIASKAISDAAAATNAANTAAIGCLASINSQQPTVNVNVSSLLTSINNNNLIIISNMSSILPAEVSKLNLTLNSWSDISKTIDTYVKSTYDKADYNTINSLFTSNGAISSLYFALNKQITDLLTNYMTLDSNTNTKNSDVNTYAGTNTFVDYKIKLYEALVENITSYNLRSKYDENLTSKTMDPTSNITSMLEVVNIDKPCFGTTYFYGSNIDYKDPTIDFDKNNKSNLYNQNVFIASMLELSEKIKNLAYETNKRFVLPNGFMGRCKIDYGNGIVKYGIFALVNPTLADSNKTVQKKSIDLLEPFGMIYMTYNPYGESMPIVGYLPTF